MMVSEIIMRRMDKEKDTFEMLVPPLRQIPWNTVITGNPCHFSYGKLALVEHSLKVDFNSDTIGIGITITVATHFKGNDPPILFDSYDVHFYSDGVFQGTFQNGFHTLPLIANEDGFRNTKYIYQWTSDCDHLSTIWNNETYRLKFVINMKSTSEKELEQNKMKIDKTEFLMDNFLSDFEIFCENETLKAHKIILANRSPKLRAMFQNDMKETREGRLVVEGIKLEVLKELLCFMYTGKEDFQPIHLVDLFKAADEYLMTDLKEKCIELIIEEICLENALDIYDAAVTHDCKRLYDVALKYLKINKMFIADGPEKLAELCQRYPELMYQLYEAQRYL